jgi:hypothetical protein
MSNNDKQLFEYLADRKLWGMRGVEIIKVHHEDFPTCEYINLVMRMGIDTVTADEIFKAGFHLYRAYNLNLEDHHIYFEFMRPKKGKEDAFHSPSDYGNTV